MKPSLHLQLSLFACTMLFLCACAPQPAPAPANPPVSTATLTPLPAPTTTFTPDSSACLQGDWQIGAKTAEQLLIYLTSTPSLQVKEGSLYLGFDGDAYRYHSDDLQLRSTFLDSYLDVNARVLISGTYLAEGDTLRFTQTISDNELYDWIIVKDEYTRPFSGTSPIYEFELAEKGRYICTSDSLTLTLIDAGEEITLDLTRVE